MYEKVKGRQVVMYAKFEGKEYVCGCNFFKPKECLCRDCDETVFEVEPFQNIEDCLKHNREIDTSKILG